MRIRRFALVTALVVALMSASALSVGAEYSSFYEGGVYALGVTSTAGTDAFGTYHTVESSTNPYVYQISAAGRGWNSDGGWHVVSDPSNGCFQCTAISVKVYRCGSLPSNCAVPTYVVGYHYWNDFRFGTPERYTSHDGAHSSYSCWYNPC